MAKTKDKGGRPRRVGKAASSKLIALRVTAQEQEAYSKAATADEISLSDWIRAACQERLARGKR